MKYLILFASIMTPLISVSQYTFTDVTFGYEYNGDNMISVGGLTESTGIFINAVKMNQLKRKQGAKNEGTPPVRIGRYLMYNVIVDNEPENWKLDFTYFLGKTILAGVSVNIGGAQDLLGLGLSTAIETRYFLTYAELVMHNDNLFKSHPLPYTHHYHHHKIYSYISFGTIFRINGFVDRNRKFM